MHRKEVEKQIAENLQNIHKLVSIIMQTDESVVEDVTQDILVRCLSSISKYNPAQGSVRTWMQVIARRYIIDYMRANRVTANTRLLTETGDMEEVEIAVEDEAPVLDEVDEHQQERLKVLLHKNLQKLSEEQRRVLTMYYVEGKTDKEIAATLGIVKQSANDRRRRALTHLRKLLGS